MAFIPLPFVGGAYKGRSVAVSAQECINLFPEMDSHDTRTKATLVGTPGTTLFTTAGDGPIRGLYTFGAYLFAVSGNKLYRISSDGTATEKGTLSTSTGIVTFADNGSNATSGAEQLMIVDGTGEYIYDLGADSFAAISDTDCLPGYTVQFMDGYFIKDITGTGRFQISALYDGTTWDALDFATAESNPDDLVAILAKHQELWLFGTISTEVWYNSGNADFPFERYQGGFVDRGLAARFSVCSVDNSLIWLARDEQGQAQVVRAMGPGNVKIISPQSISWQLQQYSDVSDAFAYSYQSEGHDFYVITFPTGNATWVYDASNGEWHRRANTISANTAARQRFVGYAFYNNKHLVGDYSNGRIYQMSTGTYTYYDDEAIVRVRTAYHTSMNENRLSLPSFQLVIETAPEGPDDPPICSLSWSKDNGKTFGTAVTRSMDAVRVLWHRLGRARDWVFKWTTSTKNKVIIVGAMARVDTEEDDGNS